MCGCAYANHHFQIIDSNEQITSNEMVSQALSAGVLTADTTKHYLQLLFIS